MPARCQLSPYSPPPRRFGSAKRPPASTHPAAPGKYAGVREMLNPPYPVRSVGTAPVGFTSLRCTRNIVIGVPSRDGYVVCSTGTFGNDRCPVTVGGLIAPRRDDPVVGRIEIGAEPYAIIEYEAFGDRVLAFHDRRGSPVAMLAIQQEEIATGPALERDEQHPPS